MLIFVLGGCNGSNNGTVSVYSGVTDDDDGISGNVPAKANDDAEILRILEEIFAPDKNGVPLIFTYAPLLESYYNSLISISSTGTPINFSQYVFSSDLNDDGEFVKTFALEKDNEYFIKYSHSGRTLNGSYLQFRITAPEDQVMILDIIGHEKTSFDEELENRGIISKSIYVPTEYEVIPEEAPCIMLYSFKAPVTGNYEFAIKESNLFNLISDEVDETENYEFPFEFRLYTEGETFAAADDEDINLSPRDILALQRILLDYAAEFNEEGLPISFYEYDDDEDYNYEDYENYSTDVNERISERKTNNSRVSERTSPYEGVDFNERREPYRDLAYNVLNRAKENNNNNNNNNSNKIIISPRIDNIPYDPIFTPGAGFYAHSGLRSIQLTALDDDGFSENAIEDISMDKYQGNSSTESSLNIDFISTEDEFLRIKELDNLNDFTLLKDALDENKRKFVRLGLAGSKTMYLRYEFCESEPRMPDIRDFSMRSAVVVRQLQKNFDNFQREHGDYFVAGYKFGLYYEAFIDIQAEPYNCSYETPGREIFRDAEKIADYIGNYIKDAFNDPNNTSDLIDKLEKSLNSGETKNVLVTISNYNHFGVMGEKPVTTLSDLGKELADFKKIAEQAPSSEYERLYVTLIRYREIRRVKNLIPEELPINPELYKKIRELNKIIYLARCYKSAVDSIPAAHLMNGEAKRQEWSQEFDTVLNSHDNQLNQLCSNSKLVNDYYDQFSKLLEKYQGLNHRYVFYRYMVSYQKSVPNGVGNWTWSNAKWSYPLFKVGFNEDEVATNKFIKEDIKRGRQPSDGGPHGFRIPALYDAPEGYYDRSGTFEKSYRVFYYEGGPINTNNSDGTDLRGHSFGKRSYNWKFARGFLRD